MRFDLHIHSNHSSDSSLTVDEILQQAVKKGLDGIAICDHNTVEGSLLGIRRARELNLPLIVLPGVEVSTIEGHLLVLGVKENIPHDLPYLETISVARQKGGVVIAAHPFKSGGIGYGARDADAVETFNSRCIFDENMKAKKIAQERGKPEVGGSDSHLLATIGLAYTDIEAEPDERAILSAIREGRTGSSGQVVPLSVVVIHILRGLLRKFRKPGKELYSRIFH
ncbi:PHP-associated [uncultured archaeon]|nr:PHP-associated [uncultured archaeon]